jgi:hypothetical protein
VYVAIDPNRKADRSDTNHNPANPFASKPHFLHHFLQKGPVNPVVCFGEVELVSTMSVSWILAVLNFVKTFKGNDSGVLDEPPRDKSALIFRD